MSKKKMGNSPDLKACPPASSPNFKPPNMKSNTNSRGREGT